MRATIAVVAATLTLGLGFGSVLAGADGGTLARIHMFDALTGWAVSLQLEGADWTVEDSRGYVQSLLRTTDGGIHWRDVTPSNPPGQKIRRVYKMELLDSLTAWVSATPAASDSTILFRTVDGGQTWKNVTLPDGLASMSFISARDGWFMSWEAAVYRSTDGGDTWKKIASPKRGKENGDFPFRQILSLTFLNPTMGVVTGFTDASDFVYLYVTRDGGYTWRQQKLSLPPQVIGPGAVGEPPTFFTAQDGILPEPYGSYNSGMGVVFYVTHDGGTTWMYTTPVSLTNWYRSSSFADMNHGWVVDIAGALYLTSDGGRHWTKIEPTPPFSGVRKIDFISPHVGWAVSDAPQSLQKTLDGGHTWAPVTYTISR